MLNRSKLFAFSLLVATFVAGAAVGMGVDALQAKPGRGRPMRGIDRMMARFTEDLTLTPAQQAAIRPILEQHSGEMRAIWERVRPHVDSLRARLDSEIAAQLTPEQRQRFDSLVHQHRQHRTSDSGKGR